MTRNYGINKEYAIERALAHTKKHGAKHLCMVYQKVDFDGTMEIALPNPGQLAIDLDDEYVPMVVGNAVAKGIKAALGIETGTTKEEVFPF